MKALTIWQPWASLLVSGQKKYETRSWATAYRGPIAIHAAMRPVRRTIDALAADREGSGWDVLERLDSLFLRPGALDQLPTGAIVGKAILTRCNLITEDFRAKLSPQELDLGDFSIGRYAWEFHVMVPVDPPVKAPGSRALDLGGKPGMKKKRARSQPIPGHTAPRRRPAAVSRWAM